MSFQQGLSGLNASSKNLEVIANNIANANTYGAKSSRAEFAAVYATALNGSGANAIGIRTTLQVVAQQFTQGNVSTTDNPLDLAIHGAGSFQATDGQRAVGYAADSNGVIQPGASVPLRLPTGGIDPNPPTRVDLELNLDSRLGPIPAAVPMIDFADATTYNNATSLTMYDLKGQDVAVSLYFQKAANDQWNVYATANGTTIGGSPPTPITTLQFPPNGSAPTAPAGPLAVNVPASTNAQGAQTEPFTG